MRWSKLNQEELQALLLGMGLPADGSKKDLAKRLTAHIESLGPPPPELAADADSNTQRKKRVASAAAAAQAKAARVPALADAEGAAAAGAGSGAGPATDSAVAELLEGGSSTGRNGRSGGRRNRIHPRNWGYTTYLDRVYGMRCFNDLVRMRVFPDGAPAVLTLPPRQSERRCC